MISCGEYDYIEIVCLYRYPVRLTMKSGNFVDGVAFDTQRDDKKNECIKVTLEDDVSKLIVLDEIRSLEVLVDNPHFTKITFE